MNVGNAIIYEWQGARKEGVIVSISPDTICVV
jgi:hypothetical protein